MIPQRIVDHLKNAKVPFSRRWHPRAVSAQPLAATLHVSGYRVAKSVLVEADGKRWIAVLSAPERVDTNRLASALGARSVRLLSESEFMPSFPDCEVGAEPPFGSLYRLPVIVDESLTGEDRVLFRAGSHEETLELRYVDFMRLENPRVASFAIVPGAQAAARAEAGPEARA